MLYNGRPATSVTTTGANELDITEYAQGVVGGGVLLDIPRLRGVPWLEPGTAVTRAELEDAERAAGVRLGEGGLLVFRTGHHRRRSEIGPGTMAIAVRVPKATGSPCNPLGVM